MDVSNASLLSSSDNTAKSGIIIGCNLQKKKNGFFYRYINLNICERGNTERDVIEPPIITI